MSKVTFFDCGNLTYPLQPLMLHSPDQQAVHSHHSSHHGMQDSGHPDVQVLGWLRKAGWEAVVYEFLIGTIS